MSVDFQAWPKIPRLASPFIVTEKIDGSIAAVLIVEAQWLEGGEDPGPIVALVESGEMVYRVYAQSRSRFITPAQDNFGFAAWVRANAGILVEKLGPGRHFGEWWGHGIQRGYGLAKGDRRFSLFNVTRHEGLSVPEIGLGVVPRLDSSLADLSMSWQSTMVAGALMRLGRLGSFAAPGFMNPEGVILFHARSKQMFKQYLDPTEKADEVSKRERELAA